MHRQAEAHSKFKWEFFSFKLTASFENDYHCRILILVDKIMAHAAAISAVIVGADRLGNIPDLLKQLNIGITHHISGRDPSHQKKTLQLPRGTDLLILLTDFLGHNVMKTFRQAAQRAGIKVVACRRSVCAMKQALESCGLCAGQGDQCSGEKGKSQIVQVVPHPMTRRQGRADAHRATA